MDTTPNTQDEDSTERVADITETWESSPLTEPDRATDPQATSPADHGGTAGGVVDSDASND